MLATVPDSGYYEATLQLLAAVVSLIPPFLAWRLAHTSLQKKAQNENK